MRLRGIFLVGVFFCFCISLSLSQQRQAKPSKVVRVAGKIEKFLKTVQEAKSLDEVKVAHTQAGFTQAELDQLKREVESSPALKQKTDQLFEQAQAAAKPEIERVIREAEVKLTALKSNHAAQLKQKQESRIAEFQRKSSEPLPDRKQSLDPNVRCAAEAPTIDEVMGPVEPGVPFRVSGKGLGASPGSVDLMTQGRVYAAFIDSWNSCGIRARLANDISGVLASDEAMIVVKTSAGKEVRKGTSFQPTLEFKSNSSEDKSIIGWYWGNTQDWVEFDYYLKNQWYVVNTTCYHCCNGHCEITKAPPTNVPNGNALTVVHQGVAAFGVASCHVVQLIAGPKGLPSH